MMTWFRWLGQKRETAEERQLREARQASARERAVTTFVRLFPEGQPRRGHVELEREADFIVSVGWDTDWKPSSVEYFVVSKDALSTRLLGSDDDWRPPMRR